MSARAVDFEIRGLAAADLDAIEAIEVRAYPSPWSRNMFIGELAKPTSICLGAFAAEEGQLIGYVVASRYVDAWHVMNVCVNPDLQGNGIAGVLLERDYPRAIVDLKGSRERALAAFKTL